MRIDPTDPTVHPGSQHRLCGVLLFKTSTKCSASIIDAKIVAAKQGGATGKTIGQTCVQLCNNRPFSKLGSCFVKGFRGPEVRCRRINIIMKGGHFLARPRNRVSHLFKVPTDMLRLITLFDRGDMLSKNHVLTLVEAPSEQRALPASTTDDAPFCCFTPYRTALSH